ncbi:MAG: thymidine phosphorylase [Gammaproteobacteria bacterium]
MLTQEIIRKKRDGSPLNKEEIEHIINGMMDESVSPSQVAAFAMSVFFNGMSLSETRILTECLLNSGTQLDWSDAGLDGPIVDKHSTGGLGDKVSLIIAPLLAACGCYVPMISGRSLGHTGGTLDKMDSIEGYNTQPNIEQLRAVVKAVGCAIVGQTSDLAPADKSLYAIRDVTATVESIPLITASILSKKIAAGLDSLVIDVKVGSGSFNDTLEVAETLGNHLVQVGNAYGVKTSACLTDMSQVLGETMGNALEVVESIEFLSGKYRNARLYEVTMSLAAELLVNYEQYDSIEDAMATLTQALDSGAALQKFNDMVSALGGSEAISEHYQTSLPKANVIVPYYARVKEPAYLAAIDGRALGNAIISLGGGRRKSTDAIDYSVGFSEIKAIGDTVGPDQPVLQIHAQSEQDATMISAELDQIFSYNSTKLPQATAIMAIIRS